ncbi:MAG TPA: hypothetical protein VKV39_14965 [Candidatus Sulfotelmatobacter sp.]|nr:hypothetical protein [Candidatus Sulfotelmatobacter sp.]
MLQRRTSLAHLREELRTLEAFDRLHEYSTDPTLDEVAHAARQSRRNQIMAEIQERLKDSKSEAGSPVRIGAAAAFVCTVGYALVHYLIK